MFVAIICFVGVILLALLQYVALSDDEKKKQEAERAKQEAEEEHQRRMKNDPVYRAGYNKYMRNKRYREGCEKAKSDYYGTDDYD